MFTKQITNGLKILLLLLTLFLGSFQAQSVVVNPSPAHIGQIPIGSSEVQSFRLLNYSVNNKEISSITVTGEAAHKFSVVNNLAPFTLSAFAEHIFGVEYTPTEQVEDVAYLEIQAGSDTIIDTLRGSGTNIYNGIPTFERLLGIFDGNLDVGGVWTISLDQADDGSFVIVATTSLLDNVGPDVYLIKTDKYGKELWYRTFEAGASGESYDSGGDQGWDAIPLNDGSILILASSNSMGPGDFSIIVSKWDAIGNFIWENAYGGTFNDIGYRIYESADGYVLIAGSTNNTSDQTENAYILKINPSDGSLIWENDFGESGGIQSGFDIVAGHDGGYVFLGNNQKQGETANISFTKIDESGEKVWNKTFTSDLLRQGNRIQTTSDGGYIVAGYSLTDAKGQEGYLIKIDGSGNMIWEKTFGTDHADDFKSVVETNDGGYMAVGSINAFFSVERRTDDFWVVKVDAAGNMQWEKQFGGEEQDAATEIIKTNEGGYAAIGMTASYTVESMIYFLQFNSEGYITKVERDINETVPTSFSLFQNYPNPFNPATKIEFSITKNEKTTLKVYDVLGREVAELLNEELNPGKYKVSFNAEELSSGIYFYKLRSGNNVQVKKMMLLK